MNSKKTFVLLSALVILIFPLANMSHANLLRNGDFYDGLSYWTGEHLSVPDPEGAPFDGEWIQDSTGVTAESGHAVIRTLGETENVPQISLNQFFEIPEWAHTFSFDISFSWGDEGSSDQASGQLGFPDSFQALWFDKNDSNFDRFFLGLDEQGAFDPETYNGISLIDLGGDWFRFTTNIEVLRGRYGTLYFDLNDLLNEKYSEVKLDNVSISPVPEPATLILLGSGLAALTGLARRKRIFS